MSGNDILRARQLFETLRATPGDDDTIERSRARYEALCARFDVPDDVQARRVDADGVPALWVTVDNGPIERTILFLHGGGCLLGSAAGYREWAGRLARECQARVLVPDYRLAPEHVFPAAPEDAHTAWRWLMAQGSDPAATFVYGDSAGGGLALGLLSDLREHHEALPAAVVAVSPVTDRSTYGPSFTRNADRDPVINRTGSERMRALYLAGQDAADPRVSPLLGDLEGLPALLLQVGSEECLLDDSVRYADKAAASGVDVTIDIAQDMVHIYPLFPFLAESGRALDQAAAFFRRHSQRGSAQRAV